MRLASYSSCAHETQDRIQQKGCYIEKNKVVQTKMRRSRLETLFVILTISIKRIRKTHIMYIANLSHQQLEKFLGVLISKGLPKGS